MWYPHNQSASVSLPSPSAPPLPPAHPQGRRPGLAQFPDAERATVQPSVGRSTPSCVSLSETAPTSAPRSPATPRALCRSRTGISGSGGSTSPSRRARELSGTVTSREWHHGRTIELRLDSPTGQLVDQAQVAEILRLLHRENYGINADIELSQNTPAGSNQVLEVRKCVEFCRDVLALVVNPASMQRATVPRAGAPQVPGSSGQLALRAGQPRPRHRVRSTLLRTAGIAADRPTSLSTGEE